MERSSDDSTSSKTNCRWHCGHSKTSGNIASRLSHRTIDLSRNSLLDRGVSCRVASMPFLVPQPRRTPSLLGGRSTVGQRALDPRIGVRIPASQPRFATSSHCVTYLGSAPESRCVTMYMQMYTSQFHE